MIRFRNRILSTPPVVVLVWTLLPVPAQAQFIQQGPKLVGTSAVGDAIQGASVSLSGDGNTAIVGGYSDDAEAGAAWVFAQPVFAGTPGKANCQGKSFSALAQQFGGLNSAAAAPGVRQRSALQDAIMVFCEG